MKEAWNLGLTDEELEERMIRGRARLVQLQRVLTHTYGRLSVSDIARQLGCSREKVIWMQHVLQLRTDRGRQKPRSHRTGGWPAEPKETNGV